MIISAVANVILDPILIFGLTMGVRGAAVATILGKMTIMRRCARENHVHEVKECGQAMGTDV